jgi:hypothetical protein
VSDLAQKADIQSGNERVRIGPKADMCGAPQTHRAISGLMHYDISGIRKSLSRVDENGATASLACTGAKH